MIIYGRPLGAKWNTAAVFVWIFHLGVNVLPLFLFMFLLALTSYQGGNFHLKVGGAKSSGNAGDPMLGVAVSGGYNYPNHKVGGG